MGKPYRAVIEGAKMTVCSRCAKLASEYWEEPPIRRAARATKPRASTPRRTSPKRPSPPRLVPSVELADDYRVRVRKARENLGFTHEDLGRKIGEKVSVLRKIESGKMAPDHAVAQKLEHALRIKLLVQPSEPKAPLTIPSAPLQVTLGEMIQTKKRSAEASGERKSS
jgi:putative transcription factor